MKKKAEHYPHPHARCASTCIIPSIRELSWYYKYGKNCGELDEIIDEAYAKMVKHQSSNLTRLEYMTQLHKYIMEGIQCKEIEQRIKLELKLQ